MCTGITWRTCENIQVPSPEMQVQEEALGPEFAF